MITFFKIICYNIQPTYSILPMGKVAHKLPDEYKEKALANNLSIQTVYARIKRGWDLERAVTEKPKNIPPHLLTHERVEGMIQAGERPKSSYRRGFFFYKDSEELLDRAITSSGLTQSDFYCHAIEQYLLKLWKKDKTIKKGKK